MGVFFARGRRFYRIFACNCKFYAFYIENSRILLYNVIVKICAFLKGKNMKKFDRFLAALLLIVSLCSALISCEFDISTIIPGGGDGGQTETITELTILGEDRVIMQVGDVIQLKTNAPDHIAAQIQWTATEKCLEISGGTVRAISTGASIVTAKYGNLSDRVIIIVENKNEGNGGTGSGTENGGNSGGNDTQLPDQDLPEKPATDPYVGVNKTEFYADYEPAADYWDAYFRTQHGLMSGNIGDQDQAPNISAYQPRYDGLLVRNSEALYGNEGNSYTIVDACGNPVMTIYRGGAYVMLEEVAAYVLAFGEPPANHSESKKTKPTTSIWGEYLRVNHTKFSGDTSKYPYEPVLPNISGCGGSFVYYEMDVGTTGTDCDPSYTAKIYNDGNTITRGAARIVYTVKDTNGNKIIDINEKYVFYTYNHYNDFQEYLNYYGGWGEMFGNITGGGTISSKTHYNPTPYVRSVKMPLTSVTAFMIFDGYFLVVDNKVYA